MIIKTYKANTNISINVVLPSKKNLHVTFIPLSDGSSTFTTDCEDVQKAIESHYNFGKLFKLASERNPGKAVVQKKQKKAEKPAPVPAETTTVKAEQDENTPTPAEEATAPVEATDETVAAETAPENEAETEGDEVEATAENEDDAESEEEESNVRKVKVTDIAAAKDYLAETFGISRTAMRSTKSILEKAAEHGIEFEGL